MHLNSMWFGHGNLLYNHGQNIWQKCRITPFPLISILFAQINMFLRKDLTENSNTDVGGGTSVLKILYKGDIGQYFEKTGNSVRFAKLFCPELEICETPD